MHYNSALIQLPLVRESKGDHVRTPEEVHGVCRDLENCAQESFHTLLLNSKNRLINRVLVSLGLADSSLVHPREVFRAAIECNAAAMVLTHNHPSGEPTPSAEDIRITRQLIEAGKIIDIKVIDHVVIGRAENGSPGFLSMRESGLCAFT
jgi:DNA repair protein RadC